MERVAIIGKLAGTRKLSDYEKEDAVIVACDDGITRVTKRENIIGIYKKTKKLTKECRGCGGLRPSHHRVCWNCGTNL